VQNFICRRSSKIPKYDAVFRCSTVDVHCAHGIDGGANNAFGFQRHVTGPALATGIGLRHFAILRSECDRVGGEFLLAIERGEVDGTTAHIVAMFGRRNVDVQLTNGVDRDVRQAVAVDESHGPRFIKLDRVCAQRGLRAIVLRTTPGRG